MLDYPNHQQQQPNIFFNKNNTRNRNISEANFSYTKKKIGDYSYYLNDLIGTGYTSHVYKCHHRSQPNMLYAIKVIKLSKLAKSNFQLLQNEIKILQSLNHPNVIKFHSVYYTQNNCYIITDYCQGGTLQSHIDNNYPLSYQNIYDQILQGCSYLSEKLVIHRDLKPANIFLKGNLWKIGDFGFARFIENRQTLIKQVYKVGSPLYMPPQTLEKRVYSLKTDSFAFGVLLFYLITKSFPWPGKSDKQLIDMYKNCQFPEHMLSGISYQMKNNIINLCSVNMDQRVYIGSLMFGVKNPQLQKSYGSDTKKSQTNETTISKREQAEIRQFVAQQDDNNTFFSLILFMNDMDIIRKIKLCKILNYFNKNVENDKRFVKLRQQLKSTLKFCVKIFEWLNDPIYEKYIHQFDCSSCQQVTKLQQIRCINIQIHQRIQEMKLGQQKISHNIRYKLSQIFCIFGLLLKKQFDKMKELVGKIVLHPDFSKFYIFPQQVEQIQKIMSIC